MSDVHLAWSERAEAYRASEAHATGRDLELIVEWAGQAGDALDVATGGGHAAHALRQAGHRVVTCDPAPGMGPDVICRAEHLPFADGSFDVVVCRVAAHHFDDVDAAMAEMARVSRSCVLVSDNARLGEREEEAERLRDPTHVRCYSEEEWQALFDRAALTVEAVEHEEKRIEVQPWLQRAGCFGEEARRVRELLRERLDGGRLTLDRIVLKGVKR